MSTSEKYWLYLFQVVLHLPIHVHDMTWCTEPTLGPAVSSNSFLDFMQFGPSRSEAFYGCDFPVVTHVQGTQTLFKIIYVQFVYSECLIKQFIS